MTSAWQQDRGVRPYERAYLWWYGLAWAGGTIAYQPFLSFLLPLKIAAISGRPDPVMLSTAVLVGGVTAGITNLGWGIVGDHIVASGGRRRVLILGGLAATSATFFLLALSRSAFELLGTLFCFQLALNLLLSALVATAADEVPNHKKGLLGGVLCISAPAGAAASVVVTLPGMSADESMLWIALIVPIFVLPYVLQTRPMAQRGSNQATTIDPRSRTPQAFAILWLLRLVLQTASKAVFFFLIYYFTATVGNVSSSTIAQLTLVAAIVAAPAALLLGRVSDQRHCHRPILLVTIVAMAAGLAIMAIQRDWLLAMTGYLLFACAAAVGLALHAGYTMLRFPAGLTSGKGLGLLNLTNTLPAVLVAGLGTTIVPQHGYRTLFLILALGVLAAGSALLSRRM